MIQISKHGRHLNQLETNIITSARRQWKTISVLGSIDKVWVQYSRGLNASQIGELEVVQRDGSSGGDRGDGGVGRGHVGDGHLCISDIV